MTGDAVGQVAANHPIRRGIVLVHGIGEQPRGDTLQFIGMPIIRHLSASGAVPGDATIDADFDPGVGPPRVMLQFSRGDHSEEWEFAEAWWARSFIPPNKLTIAWHTLQLQAKHVSTIWRTFHLGIQHRTGPEGDGKDQNRNLATWAGPETAFFNPDRKLGRLGYFLDLLWTAFMLLVTFVVWVVGLPIVFLLVIIALLPEFGPIKSLQQSLQGLLFLHLSDQCANVTDRITQRSNVKAVLDIVRPWLGLDDLDDRNDVKGERSSQKHSVTVVAHSGGALVAFFALSDEQFKDELAKQTEGMAHATPVTLVTLGGSINAAYDIVGSRIPRDFLMPEGFGDRRIPDRVRWLDMWTQYDVVPAGPIRRGIEKGYPESYKDYRVSNLDTFLEDHGAYFDNREEVLSRILAAVVRDPVTGEPEPDDFFEKAVMRYVSKVDNRRRRVFWAALIRRSLTVGVMVASLRPVTNLVQHELPNLPPYLGFIKATLGLLADIADWPFGVARSLGLTDWHANAEWIVVFLIGVAVWFLTGWPNKRWLRRDG